MIGFMTNMEQAEALNPHQTALHLTQEILRDPTKIEALRAGVGRYTNRVDIEFKGVETTLAASSSDVFQTERGVAYMLWSTLSDRLRSGEILTTEDLTADELSNLIYQAYSNSGTT